MIASIVVLTGAGISAESGIKTFRDSDGLWENHPVDDVATPEGYARNPLLVQRFYNARRKQLMEVKANQAHQALADFERQFDGDFLLVTPVVTFPEIFVLILSGLVKCRWKWSEFIRHWLNATCLSLLVLPEMFTLPQVSFRKPVCMVPKLLS